MNWVRNLSPRISTKFTFMIGSKPTTTAGFWQTTTFKRLRMFAFGDENVCWLDIAMDDALGMCGIQSVGHINRQREQRFRIEWPPCYAMFQSHSVETLHHDERLTVVLVTLVDSADVLGD